MTESYSGTGWPSPTTETSYATGATAETSYSTDASAESEPSTAGVAKEQAAQVGQGAVQAGHEVASTAVEQGKNVAAEAKDQVRDLASEAKSHATSQIKDQHQKAVGGLRGLGDSLHALANGDTEQAPGIATDLAKQAAEKVSEIATWIESREPGELVDEVRDLARRRPGAFLVGAAIAGVLAGRLTRGVVAAQSDDGETESHSWTAPAATYTPTEDYVPSYASSDAFGAGDINGVTSPVESGAYGSAGGYASTDSTYTSDISLDAPTSGQVRP